MVTNDIALPGMIGYQFTPISAQEAILFNPDAYKHDVFALLLLHLK